jgi:hypothetical protein
MFSGPRQREGPRCLALTQIMELGTISQAGVRLLPEETKSRAKTGHRPAIRVVFRHPGPLGGL